MGLGWIWVEFPTSWSVFNLVFVGPQVSWGEFGLNVNLDFNTVGVEISTLVAQISSTVTIPPLSKLVSKCQQVVI